MRDELEKKKMKLIIADKKLYKGKESGKNKTIM